MALHKHPMPYQVQVTQQTIYDLKTDNYLQILLNRQNNEVKNLDRF